MKKRVIPFIMIVMILASCLSSCNAENTKTVNIALRESRNLQLIVDDGYIYSYCYNTEHQVHKVDRFSLEDESWTWYDLEDPNTISADKYDSLCYRIPENASTSDLDYVNLKLMKNGKAEDIEDTKVNQGEIQAEGIKYLIVTWESKDIPEESLYIH